MASSNAAGVAASAVAAEEVAGLDRVLTRLALTGDDKLEKVNSSFGPHPQDIQLTTYLVQWSDVLWIGAYSGHAIPRDYRSPVF